jgi:hypothetical protein
MRTKTNKIRAIAAITITIAAIAIWLFQSNLKNSTLFISNTIALRIKSLAVKA